MSFASSLQDTHRRVNFTQNEKMLLLSLIEKNKCWIVENFMDGSKGWKKKSDVWNEVVRDFNVLSQSQCHRDIRQLRKCWENMKTRYRRAARIGLTSNLQSLQDSTSYSGDYEDHLGSENAILMARIGALVSTVGSKKDSFVLVNKAKEKGDGSNDQSLHPFVQLDRPPQLEESAADHQFHRQSSLTVDQSPTNAVDATYPQSENGPSVRKNDDSKEISQNDDVSIVKVVSASCPSVSPPIASTQLSTNSTVHSMSLPTSSSVNRRLRDTNNLFQSVRSRKRNCVSSNAQKSVFKPQNASQRYRTSPFSSSNFLTTSRTQMDTEKVFRMRYLRNRVREQELRLRMMQQKIRFERERHEAVMTLLHKRAAHLDNRPFQQDNFDDDGDMCDDDWLMNVT